MRTAINSQARGLLLVLLGALGSEGFAQTNTSKPVFLGPTNLSARHDTDFRYQILIGGRGREFVGSDNFSSTTISNIWSVVTNGNGGLTNANGQLNLFSSTNASSSNPAAGTLQWGKTLPITSSWLAYMEVLVSNSLPVTSNRYATAGMNLFQSNRPAKTSPVFTNTSEASLLREAVTTNQASSTFVLNNLPFDSTFASNTASRYSLQAGSSSAALVFSNLGGTNTLFYRSSTNSRLTNSTNSTIVGTPGSGTALASPNILLPSGTNWSLTFQTHWPSGFVSNSSYLAAFIVKNQGTDLRTMLANRVVLGFQYAGGSARVATDAFASGRVVDTNTLANPPFGSTNPEFRLSYNASSSSLVCEYRPVGSTNWTNANTFLMGNSPGNLGGQWKFTPGKDSFRLILAADTGLAGGNANGSSFQMYFTDLQIETVGPEDFSTPSASNTVWVGLRYDASATNLIQQFSTPGGSYTDLADDPDTEVGLINWGTDLTTSPLRLRIGAEAGQTSLPTGAVALRNFAVIPPPGDMVYSSPNLPGFLDLDTNYGVITGIPPQPGLVTNFTIVASNPYGGLTTTQNFRLVVGPVAPILQVTTNGDLRFGVTNTNAFVVRATNAPAFGTNPLNFTATGLPAGITRLSTLGGTQAVFGGAPTNLVGTNRSIVFTASNASAGAGSFTSAVTVFPGPPRLTLVQSNFAIPSYQTSGVSTSTVYWFLSNNAAGQNPAAFPGVFFANSNFPSNSLRLISSNGQIVARTNQITNSGIFDVEFSITNAGGTNFLTNTLTINPSAPVLLLATNPVYPSNGISFGAVSNNFFQFVVDTNTPGSSSSFANNFTLSSDPASWLTINSSNGAVGGSNNLAGVFDLTVRVIVEGQENQTNLTLTSRPALPLFRVTTNRAQCGTNSSNALVMALTNSANQLSTNTFPVTWFATNLPPGLTTNLVGANFVIGSTNPTHSGVFSNITVVASNLAGATTNSNISLTILPARPALAASSNGSFLVFSTSTNTVTIALTNTNSQNTSNFPVGFRLNPTNLPAGWTTNQTAFQLVFQTINPTNILLTNLAVTVTNAGGTNSTNVSLRVLPAPPLFVTVTTNTNVMIQYGRPSLNAISLEVDQAWAQNSTLYPVGFVASSLPQGVLLTTNRTNRLIGVLGGTDPRQAGKFNITVSVTNISGTNNVPVAIDVLPAVPVVSVTTNRAQFGSNSPNAIVVTVSSNGQSPADFPLSFSFTTNSPPGGIVFTNTNASGLVASAGSTNPTVVTNNTSFTVVVSNQSGAVTNQRTGFKILPELPLFTVSNNPAQFGTPSPNVLVVTITNTAGQNTNPGQFPIFRFYSPNFPLGGINFTNTNGFTARAGSASPSLITNSASITVVVSNEAGASTNTNVSLSLLPAVPVILRTTSVDGRYNEPGTNVKFTINNAGQQNKAIYPIQYVVTGDLPDGLVLSTNTSGPVPDLLIEGTPTISGIFTNIVVSATNIAGSSALLTNTLMVLPAPPLLSVTSNNSMQFGVNVSNALVVTVTNTNAGAQNSNFPVGFVSTNASNNLSNALGFSFTNTNGFTATAGGTPSRTPGTNVSVSFSVTNAGGSASTNLTLRVLPAAPLFNVSNNAQFGSNSPNALVVTVTNTNGQNASQYPIFFSSTNLPIGGINFTNTNGLVGRAGATNPNVVTNAVITVVASNAGGSTTNTNVSFAVLPAVPQLFAATSGTIQFGVSNTSAITVTVTNLAGQNLMNFPLGFSAANLPTNFGWSLTKVADTNGVIGSTNPTLATNVTNLLITVTNAGGSASTNLTLRVLPAAPQLLATSNGTIQFGVSNTSAITVTVTNLAGQNLTDFPLAFTAANLPTNFGWSLTTVAGTNGVVGSPNPTLATNVTNLLITVTNAGGSNSTNLTLRVLPLAPTNFVYTYGPAATNRFRAGVSTNTLRVSIQTNGQNTNDFPITFSDDGSSLPDGLTLASDGLLSGTPTVATTYQSVFTAENAAGAGTNTNAITVLAGAPEITGTNLVQFTNLTTNTYFRYQVSARGVGQNWAGRDDFPDEMELTNNWNTNSMVVSNAALGISSANFLRYSWTETNSTYASLEWSQPLPVNSPWLASVTVLLTSNGVATNLSGLGMTGGDYVGGMLAAFRDGADPDNYAGTIFFGNSNHLSGFASANAMTNSNQVTNGILTNTSSVSQGWIGLRSTNVGGTNRLLVLGNPGATSPIWNTNLTLPINSWTNAAGSNSLILRLSGESMAPVDADYAVEFEEFVIVPLGDLTYTSTNLPAGLSIDAGTGLITGTLPSTATNMTSTVTISNSLGTTNLSLEFDIQ